jgi:hypothetical protein
MCGLSSLDGGRSRISSRDWVDGVMRWADRAVVISSRPTMEC